jgi:Rnl2 family RNA ligase
MEHKKYNSIENMTNKILEKIMNNPKLLLDVWYVTEKVDGSNFSITFDFNSNDIKPARRGAFLDAEEKFNNFQSIMQRYDFPTFGFKILEFLQTLHFTGIESYTVFGELCGGFYPGMKTEEGATKIQGKIAYSNRTEFIVFDIRVNFKDGEFIYLPHPEVVFLCKENNIPVIPIIFSGILQECINWSMEHNADPSEIWKEFGMEKEVEGNIREGHVIKPHNHAFMGMSRVILKDKNEKFQENSGTKIKKPKEKISDDLLKILGDASVLICTPRFNNIISKIGEYSITDFGKIMNLMCEDIIEELTNENKLNFNNEVEEKQFNKLLVKQVSSWMGRNKKELF